MKSNLKRAWLHNRLLFGLANLLFITTDLVVISRGVSGKALDFIWLSIRGDIKSIQGMSEIMPNNLEMVSTLYFMIMLIVVLASLVVLALNKNQQPIQTLFNFVILLFVIILAIALQPFAWADSFGI